jgi:nitroreductase
VEYHRVLARRRMVRSYRPDPVDPAALERIARAALRAPSAGHSQGTSILVVTDRDRRAAIACLAGEGSYVAKGRDPWLSRAPAHLVLCVEPGCYHRRYSEPDKDPAALAIPWWWVDAGASLMAVLLAAEDEGLAAGFLGAHAVPGLGELLGIPEGVTPLGVVTVGHPSDRAPAVKSSPKRPEHEVLHAERWGVPANTPSAGGPPADPAASASRAEDAQEAPNARAPRSPAHPDSLR